MAAARCSARMPVTGVLSTHALRQNERAGAAQKLADDSDSAVNIRRPSVRFADDVCPECAPTWQQRRANVPCGQEWRSRARQSGPDQGEALGTLAPPGIPATRSDGPRNDPRMRLRAVRAS